MFKAIEPIGKLLKVKNFSKSDTLFVLNTKFTTAILVLFSVLLTALDLLRTPIDCFTDGDEKRKKMMDNYCWSVGTYICKDHHVDNFFGCNNPKEENKIYQRYYQWMPLLLLIQAVISYVPAYLWKTAECGLLHKLCDDLDASFGRANWNDKKNVVVSYFNERFAGRAHTLYVNQYIGCKTLSIIFIALNTIMLNMVIPGYWSTYSEATSALFVGNTTQFRSSSHLVFPTVAKCLFYTSGPSGSIQVFDSMCLLPSNVLNQKIFVIIWIWYNAQFIASFVNLIYWAAIYYSKNLRIAILRRRALMSVSSKQISQATDHGLFGNFFILNQISKNTNTLTFVELLNELSMKRVNGDTFNLHAEKSI